MNKAQEQPRKALGRGLSALLPTRGAQQAAATATAAEPAQVREADNNHQGLLEIPIDQIVPNPNQPRVTFDSAALAELAQSIRANGVIQPLVVQKNGHGYQLVAGERRWRASKLANLEKVPAVVRDFASEKLLEVALIENIQREDLNPIEVAHALERLTKEHSLSHEEVAERTGKDRSTVTNLIRLLKLPERIQTLVAEKKLAMGHARAVLGLPTEELQTYAAEKAAEQQMSVRQVEKLVQSLAKQQIDKSVDLATQLEHDPNITAASRELESALGTRVRIIPTTKDRGRIEIEYYTSEDLDRIYGLITGEGK